MNDEIIYKYILPGYVSYMVDYLETHSVTELTVQQNNPWAWYVGFH